jgi:hypothetical protein
MDIESKKRFRESEHNAPFNSFVGTEDFRSCGRGSALLQYVSNLGSAIGEDDAAASYYKIEGARQVLSILANLTETPPERKAPPSDNLAHNV